MFLTMLLALTAPTALPAIETPGSGGEPVRLWIGGNRSFNQGEPVKVQVETGQPGYLLVLQLDPAGKVRVLFPVAPMDNPLVQANRRYELRQPGEGSSFVATDGGVGLVFAALGADPFRFDGLVAPEGDWSSAAFQIDRQSQNPEAALVNLVQGITSDRGFDYDLLDYQVAGRVAQEVEVPTWWSPMYGEVDDCMGCGGWVSDGVYINVGLGFGWGWPYYYNPWSWGYGYGYAYYPGYYPGYYPPYYPGYYPPYYPGYPGGYYPSGYIKGRPRGYTVEPYGGHTRPKDGNSAGSASGGTGKGSAPARRARPRPGGSDGTAVQGESGRNSGGKQPTAGGQSGSGSSGKSGGSTGKTGSSGGERARPRSGRPSSETRIASEPWVERERPAARDQGGWIRIDDQTVPARQPEARPVRAAGTTTSDLTGRPRGSEVVRTSGGARPTPDARRVASSRGPTFSGAPSTRSRGSEPRQAAAAKGSRPSTGSVARPSSGGKSPGGSVSRPSAGGKPSGGSVSRPAPSGGGSRPSGGGASRPRGGRP